MIGTASHTMLNITFFTFLSILVEGFTGRPCVLDFDQPDFDHGSLHANNKIRVVFSPNNLVSSLN